MVELTYNNEYVQKHSLYGQCSSTLCKVSDKDYLGKYAFNPDVACLDLDYYEKQVLKKENNDCTVDAVIGAKVFDNKTKIVDKGLLIIELRMDYVSMARLSATNMEKKDSYSRGLLSGEQPVCLKSIFVFNDAFAAQAQSWFERKKRAGGAFRNFITMSVTDLISQLSDRSKSRKVAAYSREMVWQDVRPGDKSVGCDLILKQMGYWCRVAVQERNKNGEEYQNLEAILKEIWREFVQVHQDLSEKDFWNKAFLEEEFDFLTS